MKKLFLFILTLFVFSSVQSFAWNVGCGENVPPEVCGADGSQNNGNSAPMIKEPFIGAIAFNKNTGKWSSVSKIQGRKKAKADVLSRCGEDCQVIMIDDSRCVGVAWSSSDKILGSDSATTDPFTNIGYNTRIKRSNEKALKKCEKAGGKNCKIVVNVCAIEGTTKY